MEILKFMSLSTANIILIMFVLWSLVTCRREKVKIKIIVIIIWSLLIAAATRLFKYGAS